MTKKPSRIRRTFMPQFEKDAVALVLGGRTVTRLPMISTSLAASCSAGRPNSPASLTCPRRSSAPATSRPRPSSSGSSSSASGP
jgi:hypothetical protein